jgi:hypothetical protein
MGSINNTTIVYYEVPPLEVVQIVLDDCRGEFFLAKLI